MYSRRALTLRISPELHTQIEERAAKRGVSINEWVVLALTHALTRSGDEITVTATTKYTI